LNYPKTPDSKLKWGILILFASSGPIIIVVAGFLTLFYFKPPPPLEVIAGPAQILQEALENYHTEKERYPPTLSDLLPIYLDKFPEPGWGTGGWGYKVGNDGQAYSFFLGKGESAYPRCFYDSVEGRWRVDS